MAEETDDISIKVAIDSADADKSIKQIKQSLADLKKVKAGDKLFDDAQKAAVKYREKLDDIKDAAGAAAGSGVEKLTSSMNLLKEGFVNADPGKLGIAMKGLGMAMKAIPIFLIIEGIKYLIDNFDKLKNSSGLLGKVFTFIGDVIGALIQAFKDLTDWLGITNNAVEENAQKTIDAAKKTGEATTARFDEEIALAKAAGENTYKLEISKQKAVLETVMVQLNALKSVYAITGELTTDQQKQLDELIKTASAATLAIKVNQATHEKELKEISKKANGDAVKSREDKAKKMKDISDWEDQNIKDGNAAILKEQEDADKMAAENAWNAMQNEIAMVEKGNAEIIAADKSKEETIAYSRAYFAAEDKAAREKQAKETMATITSLASSITTVLSAVADYNQAKANEAVKVNEEALTTQLSALDVARDAELSKEGLTADQKVAIEAKYKKQKYELDLAEYNANTAIKRKAFEQDKKMKIAQAIISTITGAISAVTGMISAIPGPVGIILGVVAGLAVTAAGVLQVAKIKNTTFDAGTPPSPPSITVPSASSVSTGSADSSASATPSFDLFKKDTNQNGANNNASNNSSNQPTVVKAYVVSQEITDQQTANNYSTSMGSL